jgi:hypothetical protein
MAEVEGKFLDFYSYKMFTRWSFLRMFLNLLAVEVLTLIIEFREHFFVTFNMICCVSIIKVVSIMNVNKIIKMMLPQLLVVKKSNYINLSLLI